jgi:hypothetical protein
MRRTVLFAGGPWHGQVRTVDALRVLTLEPPEISRDSPLSDVFAEPRQVAYAVSRFPLLGRVIWIGHLGAKPDESRLFEVLTSDDAKMAVEPSGFAGA